MEPSIGIIVNPRSGGDIRRAVAAAGRSTVEEKISIVRRIILGARAAGITHFNVNYEPMQIIRRATETIRDITLTFVNDHLYFTEEDSTQAAIAMHDRKVNSVAVLGGDGTNRAVVKGWQDIPLLPVSTGTNNAFPEFIEPTVAGTALALVAQKIVQLDQVSQRAKIIHISADRIDPDIALIDAVAVADSYVGSLELFDPQTMRIALLTRADPTSIGFCSIGGLLHPLTHQEDKGLFLEFAPPTDPRIQTMVTAPTAPGHYEPVGIVQHRQLSFNEKITITGEILLAFDGERKIRIPEGTDVTLEVRRDGPLVIDPNAVMEAGRHHFLKEN